MYSFRRLISSRANARRSTGPKSDAGKRRSSENARVHGCRSRTPLPPGDKKARRHYDQLRHAFFTSFAPENPEESLYVEQMFQARLRENLLCDLQSRILDDLVSSHPPGHFGDNDETPARIYAKAMEIPRFRRLTDYELTYSLKFLRALCKFSDARYKAPAAKTKKSTIEPTLGIPYVASVPPQPPPPQSHPAVRPARVALGAPPNEPKKHHVLTHSWVQNRPDFQKLGPFSGFVL